MDDNKEEFMKEWFEYIECRESRAWNEYDYLNTALLIGCNMSRSKLSKWDLNKVNTYLSEL